MSQPFTMGRPGIPDRRIYVLTYEGREVFRGRSPMRWITKHWDGPTDDRLQMTEADDD